MTSTEALRNTTFPKKLIVVGAGYIACELGHAYGALGCEVHFLVRSQYIRRQDTDVVKEFTKVFHTRQSVHQVKNNISILVQPVQDYALQ